MLVSTSHKFVLLHVPKTGGTSLKHVLTPYRAKNVDVLKPKFLKSQLGKNPHVDAREAHAILTKRAWRGSYRFAIVRNPWEVMLSHYLFFKTKSKSTLGTFARQSSFDEYIEWYFSNNPEGKFNYGFSSFYTTTTGKMALHDVFRLEDVKVWYTPLCTRLGVAERPLPVKNITEHTHYSVYYPAKTRDIVGNAFRADLHKFGYSFS